MKIVLATQNKGKVREMSAILAPLGAEVYSLADMGIDTDVEENGVTFAENAMIKARAIFELVPEGMGVVADDSGLCVDALGGDPGVYSARYGGMNTDKERNALLARNLSAINASNSKARFVCAIACILPDGSAVEVQGQCEGHMTDTEKGEGGFGYDPLFVPDGCGGLTMAEISAEEKNRISHRALALEKLKAELGKR
ncbi:MAG: RdgB/HAM1 family non-canonical purine NTP pyrophosphatase [Oscillospiraceae bacterium]|nr:RdgB/HAM1 family non-canonical purine NTP pyrophosphatase [Oscillospiraceae bacterium]